MAFSGSHIRRPSATRQSTDLSSGEDAFYSTAYNGSQGQISNRTFTPVDLDQDGYDLQLPAPIKAAPPTRPALGARLLSTFSSAQPAAVALTRKGSVFHSRAKSLAGFVPKLTASPETAPEATQPRHSIFGRDLFSGESAPIRLGPPQSPVKEETEFIMEYRPTFTDRPGGGPPRRSTVQTSVHHASTTTATAKTGWFGRKSIAPTTAPTRLQDDILATDITGSLFPNGPADPLSPHAFNDLLMNATSLLQRMQAAYKEKADRLATVQPDIDAQREEVEEAETRAAHLKLQLEDMSHKAQEQNEVTREMALQLAEERMKVMEAREAAARNSVKLVRRSMDADDDDESPRRWKRGSADNASDSGFESDAEYAESIASGGCETPPVMTLTPAYDGREWAPMAGKDRQVLSRRSPLSSSGTVAYSAQVVGSERAAWATAEQLRSENVALRRQMEEMQVSLQGCIDLVGGARV
ncbi:hypothetical protein LTR53_013963 [Teratosphaeriaceae sp. CCFEE 6253]|nr:hypothetical protein LTR53_013963 [Teratosphaeriaceae sp. CCFEE 6253]